MALPWPAGAPLRTLLTGGDRLRAAPASDLPFTLVNNYGPTENTVVSTSGSVPPATDADPASAPSLGQPIANTRAYVLDDGLNLVPQGVPGELCVGGLSLARGYLNRPGLTADRFVPDPFSRTPGERLYRTGDLVRSRPDGSFEFLGRLDHQVKIRGFRIELGEIEAVLGQHPAVQDCIVVARQDGPAGSRLAGYVVARADGALTPAALQVYARERLPEYMVPASIVLLDALPQTPNGKVDRSALPEPRRDEASSDFVAPRGPVEETVARIWGEVLGVERIGAHESFFELGGHSLLASQVIARLREALGVDLPLRRVFEAPTVAACARAIAELPRHGTSASEPAIAPIARSGHRVKLSALTVARPAARKG
jgi:acyl carrier protein